MLRVVSSRKELLRAQLHTPTLNEIREYGWIGAQTLLPHGCKHRQPLSLYDRYSSGAAAGLGGVETAAPPEARFVFAARGHARGGDSFTTSR